MIDTQAMSQLIETAVAKVMQEYAKPHREYMTINEVCEELKLSRWTVEKHIRVNGMPHVKVEKRVLIERTELYKWLDTFARK